MKKLVIHIGTPKTGSTTLQSFLSSKDFDNVSNVSYPKYFIIGKKNASFLLYDQNSPIFINGISKIEDELNNNDLVIISEEILSFHFVYNEVPFNNNGFIYPANVAKNFIHFVKKFKCKVEFLIYLRRQDSYIESEIKETIKGYGKFVPSTKNATFKETFDEYIVSKEKMLDYGKWINNLIEMVGKENVKIKSFDKCIKKGLIKDFVNTYNLNLGDEVINKYEKYENKSPSLLYLYYLNKINSVPKYNYLIKTIHNYWNIGDNYKVSLFSKSEAENLVNKYRESNKIIEDYNGEDLFSYDFSNYPSLFDENSKYVKKTFKKIIRDAKNIDKNSKPNFLRKIHKKVFKELHK